MKIADIVKIQEVFRNKKGRFTGGETVIGEIKRADSSGVVIRTTKDVMRSIPSAYMGKTIVVGRARESSPHES